jgi:multidrug transporter EmrE-like cation transporter
MLSPYVLLAVAIGVEVGATASLRRTRGFHDLTWTLVVVVGYVVALWMLGLVVRQIPVSVAYAIWAGLGTATIAVIGVVVLGERMDAVKFTALAMIVAGVVMLELHSPG